MATVQDTEQHSINRYTYTPLETQDSIRVIVLQPGQRDDAIHIQLQVTQLPPGSVRAPPTKARYEAVSYTWATEDGDASLSAVAFCDGNSIPITKNCEAAIRAFRHVDRTRILWIDAICINQDDNQERSQQVMIMLDIYAKAKQVLVWLGPDSHDIDEISEMSVSGAFLHWLSQTDIDFAPDSHFRATVSAMQADFQSLHTGSVNKAHLKPITRGLIDVINRKWWSRVWVLQEVALNNAIRIYCGKINSLLDRIPLLISYLDQTLDEVNQSQVDSLLPAYYFFNCRFSLRLSGLKAPPLLRTLRNVRDLQSSRSVDKLYGIQGLLRLQEHRLPSPNYDIAPWKVFAMVYAGWQDSNTSLDMLYHASGFYPGRDCPSWIADWSEEFPFFLANDTPSSAFKVCGDSHSQVKISSNMRTLTNLGYKIDSVDEVNIQPGDKSAIASSAFPFILPWLQRGDDVSRNISTAARIMAWAGPETQNAVEEDLREWYSVNTSKVALGDTGDTYTWHPKADYTFCQALPVCTTRQGRLASTVHSTLPGDHIVLLSGGALPFILRPNGDEYNLVGYCYIDEIMQGEAWPDNHDVMEWFSLV